MSYRILYEIEGDFKIPKKILDGLFKINPEIEARIFELEILDDDVMTVSQLKELQKLNKERKYKTADYNGIIITTDPNCVDEATLFYSPERGTGSVRGYDGNDLNLKTDSTAEWLIPSDNFFADNYDSNLDLVCKVCEAFNITCNIKHYPDNESDDDCTEKIILRYVNGKEQL